MTPAQVEHEIKWGPRSVAHKIDGKIYKFSSKSDGTRDLVKRGLIDAPDTKVLSMSKAYDAGVKRLHKLGLLEPVNLQ